MSDTTSFLSIPIATAELTQAQKERWARSLEEARKKKALSEQRYRQTEQQPGTSNENSKQQTTLDNNRPATAIINQHHYNKKSIGGNSPRQADLQRRPKIASAMAAASQFKPDQPFQKKKACADHETVPTSGQNEEPMPEIFFSLSLLGDAERFKLTYSPYRQLVADKLKEIPSRNYNFDDKSWNFPLHAYEKVKAKIYELRTHKIKVVISEVPMSVRQHLFLDKVAPSNNVCQKESELEDGELLRKVDHRLRDVLFPFQRRGVSFGIKRSGRLLIADEMGLGKTVQAIAIASAFRNEWPLLIVCPSSVKYMWQHQISRFLTDTRAYVIEKGKEQMPTSRATNLIIIMSYDLMAMRKEELKRENFYVLIFDECHMLKEAGTKRTRAADELAKRAHRVLLLSGTPALSRPAELFTQIRMIDPKIFPVYKAYAIRYCEGRQGRYGFEAKGQSNPEELKAVMSKIMIRRMKKDVLEDLPAKRREIIFLSGDSIDNKMKELRKAREELMRNDRFSTDNRVKTQTFMEYYVLTGQAKMDAVSHHIKDTYFYEGAPEKKILIFAHHLAVLDHLGIQLAKIGVQYIRIDGTTSARDRQAYCDQFQRDTKTKAAILSITAAGTGITLTAASIVIFAELYWNPALLIQAEDRAHRVGQRDSVHVHYMLARNTADMDIWDMVKSKLQVLGNVNLAGDNYGEAKKTNRYCPDFDQQHLMTDFFSLLNGIDIEKGQGRHPDANDGTLDLWLKQDGEKEGMPLEPDRKRAKSNTIEEEEENDLQYDEMI